MCRREICMARFLRATPVQCTDVDIFPGWNMCGIALLAQTFYSGKKTLVSTVAIGSTVHACRLSILYRVFFVRRVEAR